MLCWIHIKYPVREWIIYIYLFFRFFWNSSLTFLFVALWSLYCFIVNHGQTNNYNNYRQKDLASNAYREALSIAFFESRLFLRGTFETPINLLATKAIQSLRSVPVCKKIIYNMHPISISILFEISFIWQYIFQIFLFFFQMSILFGWIFKIIFFFLLLKGYVRVRVTKYAQKSLHSSCVQR